MKKTISISICVAVLAMTATTATAKSWRINNDVSKKADFTDLNAAMSNSDVQAGDTLYLDPNCAITGTQTVTKQVTIVGSGYFRTNAPQGFSYIMGALKLNAQYIKVEGVIMTDYVYLYADYITIERCKTGWITISSNNGSAKYATIRQCYIPRIYGGGDNNTSFATIENNIFICGSTPIDNLKVPTIRNNYVKCTETGNGQRVLDKIYEGIITNNILMQSASKNLVLGSVSDCTISNNVMSCTEGTYSSIGENKYLGSTDESIVFALEGTDDQRYQLKADSPAKGYATDGGDCGPFGGLYPYVISGLPAGYPYYTKANIGTRAKDGKINVSLNIKMQNE